MKYEKVAYHTYDKTGKDADEQNNEIVFASSEEEAVLQCEAYRGGGNKEDVVVTRMPSLDQYQKESEIPKQAMAELDFYVYCDGCSGMTEKDEGLFVKKAAYCTDCQEELTVKDGNVYFD